MVKKDTHPSEQIVPSEFSSRLSDSMKVLGENKSSLARKTGLSEAAIRSYLKSTSSPSVEQLLKISRATGISAAWFLGEQENMHVNTDNAAEDQSLLMMIFPHLSGAQRQLILSQILTVLAKQYGELYNIADIRSLSSPIIEIALKINLLSADKKQVLEELLRKTN